MTIRAVTAAPPVAALVLSILTAAPALANTITVPACSLATCSVTLTLQPGDTAISYLSDSSYVANLASIENSIGVTLPPVPNFVSFGVLADPSSIGAVVAASLLTYSGTPVIDLGTATLASGYQGRLDTFGVEHTIPISAGYGSAVGLSFEQQQSLFEGPALVGFGNDGIGWFRADFTNAGTIPVTIVADPTDPCTPTSCPAQGESFSITLNGAVPGANYDVEANPVPPYRPGEQFTPEPATGWLVTMAFALIPLLRSRGGTAGWRGWHRLFTARRGNFSLAPLPLPPSR